MPNYVLDTLKRLQHEKQQPQISSHAHLPVIYGKTGQSQYTASPDTSQLLTSQETTKVQLVLGTFLYYTRAIDGIMLIAINDICTNKPNLQKHALEKIERLLNYVATYQHVKLKFHASDIILQVDSDTAYLILPKARSTACWYTYIPYEDVQKRTIQESN